MGQMSSTPTATSTPIEVDQPQSSSTTNLVHGTRHSKRKRSELDQDGHENEPVAAAASTTSSQEDRIHTHQGTRQDADQWMGDEEDEKKSVAPNKNESIKSDSASVPSIKRIRSSFTERAKADIVTLPLVFSFLDVYSVLKSRRVCRTWSIGSRRSLAWKQILLSCNIEYLCYLPQSSLEQLHHICLVRDLKTRLPDLKLIFIYLSGLKQLQSLRFEEITIDPVCCDLLATYLPQLKSFDAKMANEYDSPLMTDMIMRQSINLIQQQEQQLQIQQQLEHEDDDDDPDEEGGHEAADDPMAGVDPDMVNLHQAEIGAWNSHQPSVPNGNLSAAGSSSTTSSIEEVYSDLPTLNLPHLQTLKLPYLKYLPSFLALTLPLKELRTLQFRRLATVSKSLDTEKSEAHFIRVLNQRFKTTYANKLKHLSMVNIHFHPFHHFDFRQLNALTHLSLTQNSNFHAITREALEFISRLEQLEECEIKIANGALEVCGELEWWLALCSIRSLVSFAFWNPNKVAVFDEAGLRTIWTGFQTLVSSNRCRLHTLQLGNSHLIDDKYAELISQAKHLHTLSFYDAAFTLSSLQSFASLPNLSSLELIACRDLQTKSGMVALIHQLPKLRSLSFRLPSATGQKHENSVSQTISEDAWMELPKLASLTSLKLSGYGVMSQKVIDGWCRTAIEGERARQLADEATLKRFAGLEEIPNAHGSTVAAAQPTSSSTTSLSPSTSSTSPTVVGWQELRLSGWMLSLSQGRQLLAAMPQLQLMSVHLVASSHGSFTSPTHFHSRLLLAGGDYMQRQIASYITPNTHPFE